MASTRAADGDVEITPTPFSVARYPLIKVIARGLIHFLHDGVMPEELLHRWRQTRQIAQFRLPIRIRQAAHVKQQIGVHGGAILEAEGLKRQRQGRGVATLQGANQLPQFVNGAVRGVD